MIWRVMMTAAMTPTSNASRVLISCRVRASALSASRRSSWIWYSRSLNATIDAPCSVISLRACTASAVASLKACTALRYWVRAFSSWRSSSWRVLEKCSFSGLSDVMAASSWVTALRSVSALLLAV
ncbi:hypothetical protein D3C75_1064200 [compost metagenome]